MDDPLSVSSTQQPPFVEHILQLLAEGPGEETRVLISGGGPEAHAPALALAGALQSRGVDAVACPAGARPGSLPPGAWALAICLEPPVGFSDEEALAFARTLCAQSRQVLFCARPDPFPGLEADSDRPPEAWVALFAACGFYRDPTYRPPFLTPWMLSLRPLEGLPEAIAGYERQLWQLSRENAARRELGIEQQQELSAQAFEAEDRLNRQAYRLNEDITRLTQERDRWYAELAEVTNSNSWKLMKRVHTVRHRLIPLGSRREGMMRALFQGAIALKREGPGTVASRWRREISWQFKAYRLQRSYRSQAQLPSPALSIPPVELRPEPPNHTATIDIIVCVHNALHDVRRCLASVVQYSTSPYSLILVDDGSGPETQAFLAEFAREQGCCLVRNETAGGYTRAANAGLRHSTADFAILLNSDTLVTPRWLDRLAACALSDLQIGVVGPLSNTASWQSIPKIEDQGDWATNPLPPSLSVAEMGELVASHSARLYPPMQLLNGFCLVIKRLLLDAIGLFDEENFGRGYGEEDDFCLRARRAGWKLALADDVYIYHAQSKSYSNDTRKQLSQRAGKILAEKHGSEIIQAGVAYSLEDRVLQGIRAHSQQLFPRWELVEEGRRRFAGKRILFVLPVMFAGGGANIVLSEGRAMQAMGVEVRLFNLNRYREGFQKNYPGLEIPVMYGEVEDLPAEAGRFDAVVATFNTSVAWLEPVRARLPDLPLGYYVQGFEPLIYPPGSEDYRRALASYTLIPGMVLFTKTGWTRQIVAENTGAQCQVVGPSVEVDFFRPRPRLAGLPGLDAAARPVRVGAMIRSDSQYRAPQLTMEVLRKASLRYSPDVEVWLFGMDPQEPEFARLPREFLWRNAGRLHSRQVARFVNELDILVDFSSHQAMGLTALEAMACGAAVIVPAEGGAVAFARHEANSLVVDTTSPQACWQAVRRLVEDAPLRKRLQQQAMFDTAGLFPERPAFNILNALWGQEDGGAP